VNEVTTPKLPPPPLSAQNKSGCEAVQGFAGSGVRAAYRGNYDRLVEIKRRYDPTNLFHINHNIPPS
jgi:Berberine and berberine like